MTAALGLDPRHVKAQNNKGRILLEQGHVELAHKRFEIALSINPDFKKATHNKLLALEKMALMSPGEDFVS